MLKLAGASSLLSLGLYLDPMRAFGGVAAECLFCGGKVLMAAVTLRTENCGLKARPV